MTWPRRLPPVPRVDWFHLLSELKRHGMSLEMIGTLIDASKSTVHYWKDGDGEPTHEYGERLIALWCHVTCKERAALPLGQPSIRRP